MYPPPFSMMDAGGNVASGVVVAAGDDAVAETSSWYTSLLNEDD